MIQRLELLKSHVHQGVALPAGATLELDADLARWLIREGVAKPKPESAPSSKSVRDPSSSSTTQEKSP